MAPCQRAQRDKIEYFDKACCPCIAIEVIKIGVLKPVKSLLIVRWVHVLCVCVLVHNQALVRPNVDLLKQNGSDPGLEDQPASKIDAPDFAIATVQGLGGGKEKKARTN